MDRKRMWIVSIISILAIILSACAAQPAQPAGTPPLPDEPAGITASQAAAKALEIVGGGNVEGMDLLDMLFTVHVNHGGNIYNVVLDAQSGDFVSLRLQEAAAYEEAIMPDEPPAVYVAVPPPMAPEGYIVLPVNITPRPPAVQGGPASPAISAQRAVEMARDHLVSIGVTDARFNYVYMDMEGGIWVWSVEFDAPGRSYEFYVNVDTGAFLQAPSGGASTPAPTPYQATPAPIPSPSPSPNQGGNQLGSPAISLERAIEIGYGEIARRGYAGSFRTHSGMSWERGQWVWELEFAMQGGRLPLVEMYINVNTGAIVKFEWDD